MCVKFSEELPGLDTSPWPGELGQRIYDNVSKDAWKLWEERMKMILNEYPPDALAEGGTGPGRQTYGRFFLRRWRPRCPWLRAATDEITLVALRVLLVRKLLSSAGKRYFFQPFCSKPLQYL
jgi:hypothetical protein